MTGYGHNGGASWPRPGQVPHAPQGVALPRGDPLVTDPVVLTQVYLVPPDGRIVRRSLYAGPERQIYSSRNASDALGLLYSQISRRRTRDGQPAIARVTVPLERVSLASGLNDTAEKVANQPFVPDVTPATEHKPTVKMNGASRLVGVGLTSQYEVRTDKDGIEHLRRFAIPSLPPR